MLLGGNLTVCGKWQRVTFFPLNPLFESLDFRRSYVATVLPQLAFVAVRKICYCRQAASLCDGVLILLLKNSVLPYTLTRGFENNCAQNPTTMLCSVVFMHRQ